MAITVETCTELGNGLWRLYAESDSVSQPTFYVWFDGMIGARVLGIPKTGGGWYFQRDIAAPSDGLQTIEIFDSGAGTPSACYPGRQFFQWERDDNAKVYRVEEYYDDEWVIRRDLPENGSWLYSFRTRYLEDCQTHRFRVRVMGTNGMLSGARYFEFRMVRRPDRPEVSYTFEKELLSSSGWTSSDWTGSYSAGWTHVTGNTTALLNSLAAVIGTTYKITFTVSDRTAGTFTVGFGGETSAAKSATGTYEPTASTTGSLIITPSSDFDGKIVVSVAKKLVLTVEDAA